MNKYDKILGEYREFDTSNLSDLGDVNKDGLTEGSVLKWNATTNKWEIGEQDASKWEGDGAGFVRPKSGGKVKAEHIDGLSDYATQLWVTDQIQTAILDSWEAEY